MNKNLNFTINNALHDQLETVWVYIKSGNTINTNYDPYRNTGYVETMQNPIPVKGIIHQISSNGLIALELGLTLIGAIEIIVNDNDAELIKNASKLEYDGKMYTTFHKNLGSRVLFSDKKLGMKSITCFLLGNS